MKVCWTSVGVGKGPLGAAMGWAVPPQHPVVAGLKGPSMALSPGLHNPVHGASKGDLGILRPALNVLNTFVL